MKRRFRFLWIACLACVVFCAQNSAAQSRTSAAGLPGKHRGAVTALLVDGDGRILSAGADGFLEIWNGRAAEERIQLSSYSITSMILRPGKPQVAIIETDGLGLFNVSSWDYETKKKLFTLRFDDSISYINYSAAGSFLIASRNERRETLFIHPETGEVLEIPEELTDSIAFAATGRSERNMICYFSGGVLSYWDIEARKELQHFEVPENIRAPVLFGNNRFLGGFDSRGLIVLDAVTGTLLARDETIREGIIFPARDPAAGNSGAAYFSCLNTTGRSSTVYRMEINLYGRLSTVGRKTVPASVPDVTCAAAEEGENVILGSDDGNLYLMSRYSTRKMDTGIPQRIIDSAASSSVLAFITENGGLGYVPLDYRQFGDGNVLNLESLPASAAAGSFTNISADAGTSTVSGEPEESHFLLWQFAGSGRMIPRLKTVTGSFSAGYSITQSDLDKISLRFPLRSASLMGGSILLLDTSGSVSVLDRESGETRFSYSSAGSMDTAFIDTGNIIIGRSAATGNTPFLTVNILTGETVALPYPGLVGIRVYRGRSGLIYGAAVNQSAGNVTTSIIQLDPLSLSQMKKIAEYSDEASSLSIAESGGNPASNLGGGAELYRGFSYGRQETILMERSAGLPVKLVDGNGHFVTLDGEGCLAWHDNMTGKLLAVLSLYQDSWILKLSDSPGAAEEVIRGRLVRSRR